MAAVTLVDISPSTAQSSPSPIQFNVLSLPDPGNDDASTIDFMLVSSTHHRCESKTSHPQPYNIHEIQTLAPHSGKYASYFVGSRIISNPALHVTTRVDPLFFALAHFQRALTKGGAGAEQLGKWQPWDQALGDVPSHILRALNLDPNLNINGVDEVGQLGHLIDVSDMCGDDLVLCKFSEERTLKWLVAKFERAAEAMSRRQHEKKRRTVEKSKDLKSMQGGSGAFSSSFTLAEEELKEKEDESNGEELSDSVLSKEEEHSIRVGGLQLICGYIPTEWKSKLSKEVGISDDDWMGKKKTKSSASTNGEESNATGEKRSRASWEGNIGQEGADALMQFTVGGSGKSASVISPSDKKEVRNAQSVGLKKLAKVNTKGMKSMASFFGAKKKKK